MTAFRCAGESALRDDKLPGTASTVRPFLLVENPGPWGVDALRDNRLPPEIKQGLRDAAAAARVRVLLIRRFHRKAPRTGFRVFAAYADPQRPWVETAELVDAEELLSLDLAALGAGRSPGLDPHDQPLFCVCTHGRHDVCCAERGRPLAEALAAAHPEQTWECSHIGGDRFAANMVVLPHGLYHGRLDAQSGLAVADGLSHGQLDLDHLRGRSGYAMPVQAAEIALRRQLGETRLDALTLVARRRDGEDTHVTFDVNGAAYTIHMRSHPGTDLARLTCQAARPNLLPGHEALSIVRS